MIKKVRSKELCIGMFIHDLNCSWLNHPFFKSGKSILIERKEIIDKIFESGIKEVFIDTDKGLDVGECPEKEATGEAGKKAGKSADKKSVSVGSAEISTEFSPAGISSEEETSSVTETEVEQPAAGKPVSAGPSVVGRELPIKAPTAGIVPEKESSSGPVFTEKSTSSNAPGVAGAAEKDAEGQEVETAPGKEPPAVEKKRSKLVTSVTINEEIANAKKIKKETIQTVRKIMDDIKLGKPIQKERVEEDVENIIESVFRNSDALVGLARLRTITDYLYSHSLSVCVMMVTFGKYLGYDPQTIKEVGLGAMLHDIGAGMVSQRIINKERGLTKQEYESVKEHVQYGYDILVETEGMPEKSLMTMYQHHERMSGTGYPRGLKGDEISQYGQAIGIVDVYDALTTKRSYRHKIQPTEALRMIYQWRGNEFNTELVGHFIRCIGIYPAGSLVGLESGLLGIVVCHKGQDLLQPVLRIVYDTKKDRYLMPYDVDLSDPSDNSAGDGIVSYEQPERWNVQPEMYL